MRGEIRGEVEVVRILSAFGIVWFHSGVDIARDIAYAGLVFFAISACFFAATSSRHHSIASRAKRLLLPCIIWASVFLAFKLSVGWSVYQSNLSLFSKILVTPSLHLWFLPFIFVCLITIDFAIRLLSKAHLAIIALLLACATLLTAQFWRGLHLPIPLGQYLHIMPAVFIGVYFGCYSHLQNWLGRVTLFSLCCVILLVASMNLAGFSVTYLVGFFASSILLFKRGLVDANRKIVTLSSLTLGVYLIHPLVIYFLIFIGIKNASLPTIAFLLSCVAVFLIKKATEFRASPAIFKFSI